MSLPCLFWQNFLNIFQNFASISAKCVNRWFSLQILEKTRGHQIYFKWFWNIPTDLDIQTNDLFTDKRWLKVISHLFTYQMCNKIINHSQRIKLQILKNLIEERLLREIHRSSPKKWNFKVRLHLIIRPITQLNSSFVLFSVQYFVF